MNIEDRMIAVEKKSAIDEVHRANVEKRLSSIENTLHKLVWLIIASLIGGMMAFIMRGFTNVG